MKWTALLPLKPAGERKTRLAGVLSIKERDALTERLLAHVVGVLQRSPTIGRIILLSQTAGPAWAHDWIADEKRGLNTELAVARAALGSLPLIVLHADLPLLAAADVAELTAAGAGIEGYAIAPDRHGRGTNALALLPEHSLRFAFGEESLAAHCAQGPTVRVDRTGLAVDLDTPEDMAAVMSMKSTWMLRC